MRKLMIAGLIALMAIGLAACSGSDEDPAVAEAQRKADIYDIDSIERRFHEATTNQDLEQMMSLWAPNATLTVGLGATATGVDEIRAFWQDKSEAFKEENYWISDHPAYKVEITVNGDRGTLHFECHYIDADSHRGRGGHRRGPRCRSARGRVVDHQFRRRDHRPGTLRSPWHRVPYGNRGTMTTAGAIPSRSDNPLVNTIARVPAKVQTKLLIAFLGTSTLLVAVGLLGQLVLGQSNDRVAALGALEQRAYAYAQLQRDVDQIRCPMGTATRGPTSTSCGRSPVNSAGRGSSPSICWS